MNAERLTKIRSLAEQNIEKLRLDYRAKYFAAREDPLNADAVRRAVESRAVLAGYEQAIREIVDGMIAPACE